jgi:glycosyltransferase involved in cell wall biosynthesis
LNNKVSIVIPVYNSEKFLENSIKSLLNQTYQDIEIICVNDGSTDSSFEILKKFANRIKIINQKNKGLAYALNEGIENMSGRWFKWFSPDDIMYPNSIEILVKTAKNFDENTIIYSNWDIVNEKGEKLRSFSESNYNNLDSFDFNVRLLDGQQINVNTTLIPNILLKTLKMNSSIDPILIDYDFFLRAGILHSTKYYLIKTPLIKFRVHTGQLSHKKIIQSLENLDKIRDQILSETNEKLKIQYLERWKTYKKGKSISKKSLELGLKLITPLPEFVTDKILVFYLNKLRRSR